MIVNRDELFKVVSKMRKHLVQGQIDAWHEMLHLGINVNTLTIRASTGSVEWYESLEARTTQPLPSRPLPIPVSCEALYRVLKDKFGSAVGLRLVTSKAGLKVEHEVKDRHDDGVVLPTALPGLKAVTPSSTQVDAQALRTLLARVVHAVSLDTTRPHLAAVEITCHAEKMLRATATDGHRLATMTIPGVELDFETLLPKAGVEALIEALRRHTGEVKLSVGDNAVVVEGSDFKVCMLSVDARFPPWQQILPHEGDGATAVFPSSVLKGAFRDLPGDLAIMEWNQTSVAIRFEPIGEPIRLEASAIMGTIDERPRAYNLRYLQEAIAALPDGEVEVQFEGDLEPIMFRHRATSTICLIMPTRM
jgi:hypothetical protein